jgi:hypothetical protein
LRQNVGRAEGVPQLRQDILRESHCERSMLERVMRVKEMVGAGVWWGVIESGCNSLGRTAPL